MHRSHRMMIQSLEERSLLSADTADVLDDDDARVADAVLVPLVIAGDERSLKTGSATIQLDARPQANLSEPSVDDLLFGDLFGHVGDDVLKDEAAPQGVFSERPVEPAADPANLNARATNLEDATFGTGGPIDGLGFETTDHHTGDDR